MNRSSLFGIYVKVPKDGKVVIIVSDLSSSGRHLKNIKEFDPNINTEGIIFKNGVDIELWNKYKDYEILVDPEICKINPQKYFDTINIITLYKRQKH